jgi:DNA sulfur modification protein DndD
MIFESIRLTNLFSYYGEQEIDLGTPVPGRNVCLIMGRNGFGKTSLLNSLKLLFTGAHYFYFATFLKWLKYRLLSYISNALPHKEYDDEIAKFIYLGSGVRWPAAARI